jgi:hypothetical protein
LAGEGFDYTEDLAKYLAKQYINKAALQNNLAQSSGSIANSGGCSMATLSSDGTVAYFPDGSSMQVSSIGSPAPGGVALVCNGEVILQEPIQYILTSTQTGYVAGWVPNPDFTPTPDNKTDLGTFFIRKIGGSQLYPIPMLPCITAGYVKPGPNNSGTEIPNIIQIQFSADGNAFVFGAVYQSTFYPFHTFVEYVLYIGFTLGADDDGNPKLNWQYCSSDNTPLVLDISGPGEVDITQAVTGNYNTPGSQQPGTQGIYYLSPAGPGPDYQTDGSGATGLGDSAGSRFFPAVQQNYTYAQDDFVSSEGPVLPTMYFSNMGGSGTMDTSWTANNPTPGIPQSGLDSSVPLFQMERAWNFLWNQIPNAGDTTWPEFSSIGTKDCDLFFVLQSIDITPVGSNTTSTAYVVDFNANYSIATTFSIANDYITTNDTGNYDYQQPSDELPPGCGDGHGYGYGYWSNVFYNNYNTTFEPTFPFYPALLVTPTGQYTYPGVPVAIFDVNGNPITTINDASNVDPLQFEGITKEIYTQGGPTGSGEFECCACCEGECVGCGTSSPLPAGGCGPPGCGPSCIYQAGNGSQTITFYLCPYTNSEGDKTWCFFPNNVDTSLNQVGHAGGLVGSGLDFFGMWTTNTYDNTDYDGEQFESTDIPSFPGNSVIFTNTPDEANFCYQQSPGCLPSFNADFAGIGGCPFFPIQLQTAGLVKDYRYGRGNASFVGAMQVQMDSAAQGPPLFTDKSITYDDGQTLVPTVLYVLYNSNAQNYMWTGFRSPSTGNTALVYQNAAPVTPTSNFWTPGFEGIEFWNYSSPYITNVEVPVDPENNQNPPDVFTDAILAPSGTWPFPANYLKGVDSFWVESYYVSNSGSTDKETITLYQISDGTGNTPAGEISQYSSVSGTIQAAAQGEVLYDYILPYSLPSFPDFQYPTGVAKGPLTSDAEVNSQDLGTPIYSSSGGGSSGGSSYFTGTDESSSNSSLVGSLGVDSGLSNYLETELQLSEQGQAADQEELDELESADDSGEGGGL